MNQAVPWQVKGVGFDAREVAHVAARRAGLPVGEWLNSVIADKARDLGVSTDDFSEDDRLDALVARLAGVAESVQADQNLHEVRAEAPRMRVEAADGPSGAQPMSQLPLQDDRLDSRDDPPRRASAARDRDLRLDEALEEAQRRASADDERRLLERQRLTVAALAKEVERLNRLEPGSEASRSALRRATAGQAVRRDEAPRPLRDAVGSVAGRLEELEARIAHRDADLANRPIVAALSRLEDRFEHMMRRNADGSRETARVEATFRDLDSRLREIAQRLDRNENELSARSMPEIERIDGNLAAILARLDADTADRGRMSERRETPPRDGSRPGRATRDAIADITQRQADLDQTEVNRASLLRGTSYPSIGQAQREQRPAHANARGVGAADPDFDAMTALQDAFARLTERMETRLDEAVRARSTRSQDDDISALKSGIATLGERLDVIRQQNEVDRAASDDRDDIDALRNEIAALQVGLTKLAPQSAIATLEQAVRELGGQIEDSRQDGVSDAVLAPLDRLRQEVRQALESQDLRTTVDSVEQQLRAVATRIERIEGQALDINGLQDQVGEVRELMRTAAHHFQAAERLEVEIAHLGSRVERLSDAPPRSAVRDLELAVNEIRTMLVEFSPESALREVSKQLGGIVGRIDALEEQLVAPVAMFDDFARRIEQANSSLAERLIKAMPRTTDLGSIEGMIGDLSGKLDGIKSASGDIVALGGLVRGLAAQIEEARLPNADAKILDGLETQVGRLAERLDRSDASLDAITSVERLVRDLFQQIDETRIATIDAAETAARSAAQEALRVALVSPAIAGEEASARATRVVEQVGQELSEFRKAQQVSEKRVHSTLLALNDTLERMVDRMVVDAEGGRLVAALAPVAEVPAASTNQVAVTPEPRPQPPVAIAVPTQSAAPDPVRAAPAKSADKVQPASTKAAPPVEISRPTMGEPMPDVSPLIAAARRAAQAAQNSASAASKDAETKARTETAAGKPAASGWTSKFRQKRPVLLSVASVVLLLGALQIVRMSEGEHSTEEIVATAAPEPTEDAFTPNASVPTTAVTPPPPAAAASPAASTSDVPPASTAAPAAKATASLLSGDTTRTETIAPATTAFGQSDKAPKQLPTTLRDLADRGDPVAQYEIGARFADGRGLARDAKSATAWFERSARQGYAPAEYRLGSIYEKGNGAPTDATQAIAWYEKAANHGNVRAMHNLAVMAAEGGAGKPDYTRAATWFTKAAEHGVRDSQYNLAILYARGLGLTQDLSQSYTWFSIAAAQGDADAGKKRDEVAAKLDAGKLAAAKAAADTFKPQADGAGRERGDPAARRLGHRGAGQGSAEPQAQQHVGGGPGGHFRGSFVSYPGFSCRPRAAFRAEFCAKPVPARPARI